MFLKRLEIGGFKSFATRSILDFEGEGVAAIVGPNGSGKSNVADAIRWVLGEQSYKTIRSKKSEDVIFSGSNAKSRASLARVSMILDNTNGKAPIDFSEIEITRSVYRDGSSEYLINGKKSRLLDVAELLARSGFGQSTYSVIGQGMVDSMLFYGPAERKVLFDEAAGVRQYEIKREQTLKKLEDAATNLIRIKDILTELNPRLSTLKKQAEKAKEKDAVKNLLSDKQRIYFASIWDRLNHKEQENRRDLEKFTAEETKINEEITKLNQEFTEVLNAERTQGGETKELRAKVTQLEEKKDEYRQKIFTLRAKIDVSFSADQLTKNEIQDKITELKKQISILKVESFLAEKRSYEEKLAKIDVKKINEAVHVLESQKEHLRSEIYTLRAKIEVANSTSITTSQDISEKIQGAQSKLNELRISDLEKKLTLKSQEITKQEKEEVKIQSKIESKRAQLKDLSEELVNFDFGVVGNELASLLDSQNLFLIQVEAAKEIADLKESIDLGREISKSLEKLIVKVGGAKEGKISGMSDVQGQIDSLVQEKETLLVVRNNLKNELWAIDHELKRAITSRKELKEEIEQLKNLKPTEAPDTKELEFQIPLKEKEITEIDRKIEQEKRILAEISETKSKISDISYDLRREEDTKAILEKELKRLIGLKPVDLAEKKKMEGQIEDNRTEIQRVEAEIQALKKEISEKSGDYQAQSKKLTTIKDALYDKQKLVGTYGGEISNIRVEIARIETKKQDMKEEIVRELGSEESLVGVVIVPELEEDSARREMERLKAKLYSIGEIDSEVENEFVEVEERVNFLTTQITDLEKAKTDLEKLISDLDGRIKKQFEISFNAIAKNFTHFFNVLFDGGEAKLELVRRKDDESPEERFGIEITAVPPGKRVRSISALSGGERTLTSLALLFAILSVNPSPFCVLDEVDAALDEANTVKFLKIVKELSAKTQFIFISHNRETMKCATHLYGITMDETHASKIISIKLEEALQSENKIKSKKGLVSA